MKDIKCVIWDLDNTLWDGTLIEGDHIKLKSGMLDILHTLDSRGILMSIASKNNDDQAMAKLKEFGIEHFFVYPEIGWHAKSHSIVHIQQNLHIGMDTMLFIDDQEFELDEVKSTHPLVTAVPAYDYQQLTSMDRLIPKVVTEESKRRRFMFIQDQKRQKAEKEFVGPSDSFLASLDMVFTISSAREEDLLRAEELTIRTNQLNSTGIQYSFEELKEFLDSPQYRLWVCELSDKYGSYGKIGLVLVEVKGDTWHIRLLLMSCRIVSRGVGTVMLSFLMKEAKRAKKLLTADFSRNERNRQMLMTYKFANFKERQRVEDKVLFENDLTIIQEYPSYIEVIVDDIQ